MPSLQFAPAERDPYIPGLNLSLAQGLVFAPAVRSPYVPGLRLTNSEDVDEITASLYNLADLATEVTTLDFMLHPTWQTVFSDPGAGSIAILNDDPALASFAGDGTDIIYLSYRGARAFELIPNKRRKVWIATNEEPEEITTWTGTGPLGVLAKGILDPVGGPYRSPVEEDRHFGWPDRTFTHDSWEFVTVLGTVNHALEVAAILLNGFTEEASVALTRLQDEVDRILPSRDVPLLGPPGTSFVDGAPVGDAYFYEDDNDNAGLNIATTGELVFYGIADDSGEFYVDGQQVGEVSGINWLGVTARTVTLSAGPHSVAMHIKNADLSPFGVFEESRNPLKAGWVITSESANNLFDPSDKNVTVIAMSSSKARILAYPPEAPGQTVTKTFRIALEECQARGFLPYVRLGFTDDTYTDGSPAPTIPDIGSKVSGDLLAFTREIAATYVDVKARVINDAGVGWIEISMWERGARGVVTGVAFEAPTNPNDETTGNLRSYDEDEELRDVRRLLVRWLGGWAQLLTSDGPGGSEAALEIGSPINYDEVIRMATAAMSDVNAGKAELTAGLSPRNAQEAPYSAFEDGDYITGPSGQERVVSITFSEDPEDGKVLIDVGLRDLLYSQFARYAIEVGKGL